MEWGYKQNLSTLQNALATETNNMRYGDYEEEEDDVLFNRSVIASVCAGASCAVKQRL